MAHPGRRRPHLDIAFDAILREAPPDQHDADQRDDRERHLVGHLADAGDQRRPRRPPRDEHVAADENHQPDDQDRKTHPPAPSNKPAE